MSKGVVRKYGQGGIVRVTCGERGRNVDYFARLEIERMLWRQSRVLITLGGRRIKQHVTLVCQDKLGEI